MRGGRSRPARVPLQMPCGYASLRSVHVRSVALPDHFAANLRLQYLSAALCMASGLL